MSTQTCTCDSEIIYLQSLFVRTLVGWWQRDVTSYRMVRAFPGWTEIIWRSLTSRRSRGGLPSACSCPAGSWPLASGGAPLPHLWSSKTKERSLKPSRLWPLSLSIGESLGLYKTFGLACVILTRPSTARERPKQRSRLRLRSFPCSSTLLSCTNLKRRLLK